MPVFNGEKLTLENITNGTLTIDGKPLMEKLNLIIVTNTKTYDTSLYNIYKYDTWNMSNIVNGKKALILAKKQVDDQSQIKDGDDIVVIYEGTVQDIKIKSKRNFLNNQSNIVKKS